MKATHARVIPSSSSSSSPPLERLSDIIGKCGGVRMSGFVRKRRGKLATWQPSAMSLIIDSFLFLFMVSSFCLPRRSQEATCPSSSSRHSSLERPFEFLRALWSRSDLFFLPFFPSVKKDLPRTGRLRKSITLITARHTTAKRKDSHDVAPPLPPFSPFRLPRAAPPSVPCSLAASQGWAFHTLGTPAFAPASPGGKTT